MRGLGKNGEFGQICVFEKNGFEVLDVGGPGYCVKGKQDCDTWSEREEPYDHVESSLSISVKMQI